MTRRERPAPGSSVSLARRAWNTRQKVLLMGEVQGQGSVGQVLGVADVPTAACFRALDDRVEDPKWEGRDRFLLPVGRHAIALYAVLLPGPLLVPIGNAIGLDPAQPGPMSASARPSGPCCPFTS